MMTSIHEWLQLYNLGEYACRFQELGLDDLTLLKEITVEESSELFQTIGHRARFRRALRNHFGENNTTIDKQLFYQHRSNSDNQRRSDGRTSLTNSDVPSQSGMALNSATRLSYIIDKTWDGKQVQHERFQIFLSRIGSVVELRVEAPLLNSPPAPDGEPGKPFANLWHYEVVEAYFLNDKDEYLVVELCPFRYFSVGKAREQNISRTDYERLMKFYRQSHGQHLVMMFRGEHQLIKDKLPLSCVCERGDGHWSGRALIPQDYFPPRVTKFNASAAHGSGSERSYEVLYKVLTKRPEFHRLEYFEPIDFARLVPENATSAYRSSHWTV